MSLLMDKFNSLHDSFYKYFLNKNNSENSGLNHPNLHKKDVPHPSQIIRSLRGR